MTVAQLFAQYDNGRGYAWVKSARYRVYGSWVWSIERNAHGTYTIGTPHTTYHNVSGDVTLFA